MGITFLAFSCKLASSNRRTLWKNSIIDTKNFFSFSVDVAGIKLYNTVSLTVGALVGKELLLSKFCRARSFESGASCGKERQSVVC